jgi:hypothetical protein
VDFVIQASGATLGRHISGHRERRGQALGQVTEILRERGPQRHTRQQQKELQTTRE